MVIHFCGYSAQKRLVNFNNYIILSVIYHNYAKIGKIALNDVNVARKILHEHEVRRTKA